MSLIDDTCDGCGSRFDPMGDPLLKRDPTPSEPWRVLCAQCAEKPEEQEVSDLTAFILARVQEDEESARAALKPADWDHFGDTAAESMLGLAESEGAEEVALQFFSRHDPARVLAQCEAKRRIVAGVTPERDPYSGHPDYDPLWILRALASVYSDHADYREEWR